MIVSLRGYYDILEYKCGHALLFSEPARSTKFNFPVRAARKKRVSIMVSRPFSVLASSTPLVNTTQTKMVPAQRRTPRGEERR